MVWREQSRPDCLLGDHLFPLLVQHGRGVELAVTQKGGVEGLALVGWQVEELELSRRTAFVQVDMTGSGAL